MRWNADLLVMPTWRSASRPDPAVRETASVVLYADAPLIDVMPRPMRTMIMEKTRPTMGDIYSQAEKILNQKVRKGTYCVQQDVLEPRSGFVEDEKCKKCGGVDHPRLKHEKDDWAIAVVHKRHDCPIHAPNPKRDKP